MHSTSGAASARRAKGSSARVAGDGSVDSSVGSSSSFRLARASSKHQHFSYAAKVAGPGVQPGTPFPTARVQQSNRFNTLEVEEEREEGAELEEEVCRRDYARPCLLLAKVDEPLFLLCMATAPTSHGSLYPCFFTCTCQNAPPSGHRNAPPPPSARPVTEREHQQSQALAPRLVANQHHPLKRGAKHGNEGLAGSSSSLSEAADGKRFEMRVRILRQRHDVSVALRVVSCVDVLYISSVGSNLPPP